MSSRPRRILVVANETVVGRSLIDAVKARAERGPITVHVICPQNTPRGGWTYYDEEARWAADNRLRTTIARLREEGISADGEVMDPDPFAAVMDALADDDYDEIIISTYPTTRSGWLRRDLVGRVRRASGRSVEHVVVDPETQAEEGVVNTLVVANQTVDTDRLFQVLKAKAADAPHRFTVISPQGGGGGGDPYERLAHMLRHMEQEGLEAVGQVMHPDPFTAVQNALQFYPVDEIVISTFPEERSGWLRQDLVRRVQGITSNPVEHVVADVEPAAAS